jgi:hypothetical protein
MKKIVRLTESQLTDIIKRVIVEGNKNFFLRRSDIIEKFFNEALDEVSPFNFVADDYKDYKSEVLWNTLSGMEDEHGEVKDVDGFFEYMDQKEFNTKIKKGYLKYSKQLSMSVPPSKRLGEF